MLLLVSEISVALLVASRTQSVGFHDAAILVYNLRVHMFGALQLASSTV